jgi:ABC-2 type transport system permease protein
MRGAALLGTWRLVRFAARRDRVRLAVWVLGVSAAVVVSAASLLDVYATQASIEGYVRLFGDNPALVVFAGPGYGFDEPSIGVILVNETQLWGMIGVALMSIFLLNRQTRAEEESERTELLRSLVVGRHAPVAAATVVVTVANAVVAALTCIGFVVLGYPAAGSLALSGSFVGVGLMFVGVTAVMAQVFGTGRSTLGAASTTLLLAFVVRAVGDVGVGGWLTWCSPIGWAQAVRAFAGERWWTLAVCVIGAAVLVTVSFWLGTVRDLGAGLWAGRTGRSTAPSWMTHPLGLAVRLARGLVAGWMVGLFVTGVVFGVIADDIDEMLAENPQMAEFFAQLEGESLTDAYLSTATMMLGLIASGLSVALVLVPHGDESKGRAAWMLAGPLGRSRWLMSHVVTCVGATVAAIGAAGLGIGVAYAWVTDDLDAIPHLFVRSLVAVPAALLLAGAAVAIFGLAPRGSVFGWAPLVVSALVLFLGEVLQLPHWVRSVSPFEHVPVAGDGYEALSMLGLSGCAVALVALGWWGVTRRDIADH